MKTTKFLAILALLSLISCVSQRQDEVIEPNIAKFYPYNPADTIDNPYYHNLLMVDSTRVYYKGIRDSHPISDSNEYSKKYEDSLYAAEAKIWLSIMDLASKKKWEECLRLYEKNHVPLYYVLESSLVMFNADYHVFSEIMYDYYPEAEADENNLKLFEEDFWITSYAMYSDDDYFPEHIERLSWIMSCLYAKLGNKEMALLMADNYKEAVNLSYGAQAAMHNYTKLCIDLYSLLGDNEKVIENMIEYKNFMIQYAKDNDLEIDDYINRLDATIEKVRSDMDE